MTMTVSTTQTTAVTLGSFDLPLSIRRAYLDVAASPAGSGGSTWTLNQVLSASCTYSWKQPYPDCQFWIPRAPPLASATQWVASTSYMPADTVRPVVRNGHLYQVLVGGTTGVVEPVWPITPLTEVVDGTLTWREAGADVVYDDEVTVSIGAGAHNAVRFVGLVRRVDYRLWPRAVGVFCNGYLVRASEYENNEDPNFVGGLLLQDFAGSATPTDQAVVQAVLTKARVPYVATDIEGTSQHWGTIARPQVFLWRSGTQPNPLIRIDAIGENASSYIGRWDAVSAVYTDPLEPLGFYRTFETVNGVLRQLIGGRPRVTEDFVFTEGTDADIIEGSAQRSYPLANRVFVTGFDAGLGIGPVSNIDSLTIQSSNPYMPSTQRHTYASPPSSPFIERGLDSEAGDGMSCERVANAVMPDVNRETVTVRFTTGRDDQIHPGHTVLVQGPGGIPGRLGLGEKLWVDEVICEVTESAIFQQTIAGTGGGLPDGYTPLPRGL
jgi:hypothetical protein